MKRWLRRIVIVASLIVVAGSVLFEMTTHVGRGWLSGEAFYDGRPTSFWAAEIERWESHDPIWATQAYVRRSTLPQWLERMLPDPGWPTLLDGDRAGLPVLEALRSHHASTVQDWARIGIERFDNDERGPHKFKHPSVILTAQLFEVPEAFYKELVKTKWRSVAELEEMERKFLAGTAEKGAIGDSLFDRLGKQQPILPAKEIKLDLDKEGVLLSLANEIACLPSPAQRRKGENNPQKIVEGMILAAHVQISADRRFVRVRFSERCSEVEGIEKVSVAVNATGAEAIAEIAFVKASTWTLTRTIPDGGTLLLPLQHRPAGTMQKQRWLVATIVPRIWIEAEERQIRGLPEK